MRNLAEVKKSRTDSVEETFKGQTQGERTVQLGVTVVVVVPPAFSIDVIMSRAAWKQPTTARLLRSRGIHCYAVQKLPQWIFPFLFYALLVVVVFTLSPLLCPKRGVEVCVCGGGRVHPGPPQLLTVGNDGNNNTRKKKKDTASLLFSPSQT